VFLFHSLLLFRVFFGGVSVVLRKGGGFVRRELWSREKAEEGGGRGAMEAVDSVVNPIKEFAKDSVRLVNRCHKPDRKEFSKVAFRTGVGCVVMGFIGFFVKLLFIPINNIIIGST
jgi:protein transport protein SEC61 subunit gamma-like protein